LSDATFTSSEFETFCHPGKETPFTPFPAKLIIRERGQREGEELLGTKDPKEEDEEKKGWSGKSSLSPFWREQLLPSLGAEYVVLPIVPIHALPLWTSGRSSLRGEALRDTHPIKRPVLTQNWACERLDFAPTSRAAPPSSPRYEGHHTTVLQG